MQPRPTTLPIQHHPLLRSMPSHFVRQQISESYKHFPPRRSTRQPPIESAVKDQIIACVIVHRPKVANRVPVQERLGKTPKLSRQTKLPCKWVRHRERLAELGAVSRPIGLFVEEKVKVAVKPLRVNAREDQTRVARAANVKIGSLSTVDAAEIADGNRGI